MERLMMYVRNGTFTAAKLTSRNPYLDVGEAIYEKGVDAKTRRVKVGPGFWNDLPYFQDVIFTQTGTPTNPIGDANVAVNDLSVVEIVQKMLFPYAPPVISGVVNNAAGTYANVATLEIGQSVSAVNVVYSITNPANLSGGTPINATAGGIFNNEGAKANSSPISLTLASPLAPTSINTYVISLTATHTNGTTSAVTTSFRFFPKAIWGVSPLTSYSASDINNLSQKQTLVTNTYEHDYEFTAPGYCVVALPAMLGLTSLTFTDVTNPNAPATFSMEDLGTLTINNGTGSYLYQIFRSTYYITAPTSTLRIA